MKIEINDSWRTSLVPLEEAWGEIGNVVLRGSADAIVVATDPDEDLFGFGHTLDDSPRRNRRLRMLLLSTVVLQAVARIRDRLVDECAALDVPAKQVAAVTGVVPQSVTRWYRERRAPRRVADRETPRDTHI